MLYISTSSSLRLEERSSYYYNGHNPGRESWALRPTEGFDTSPYPRGKGWRPSPENFSLPRKFKLTIAFIHYSISIHPSLKTFRPEEALSPPPVPYLASACLNIICAVDNFPKERGGIIPHSSEFTDLPIYSLYAPISHSSVYRTQENLFLH